MKAYRGLVRGNTIILEEEPGLPEDCLALVEISPLEGASEAELVRQQIDLMAKPHRGGKLARHTREDLNSR